MNKLFLGTLAASLLALGWLSDARAIPLDLDQPEARVTMTLTGKLVLTDPGLSDILTHLPYDATIDSGGQTFHLQGARLLPKKLDGKQVTVRGRLVWGPTDLTRPLDLVPVVVVEDCRPVEVLPVVVLVGRLRAAPGEGKSQPPVKNFQMTVDGKTYDLAADSTTQRKEFAALEGHLVRVTGTLHANGCVVVTKVEDLSVRPLKWIKPLAKDRIEEGRVNAARSRPV